MLCDCQQNHRRDIDQIVDRPKIAQPAAPPIGHLMETPHATPTEKRCRKKSTRWTRSGCLTCKRRRKRCDEAKPECRECARLGLSCKGYGSMWAKPFDPAASDHQEIQTSKMQKPTLSSSEPMLFQNSCEAPSSSESISSALAWSEMPSLSNWNSRSWDTCVFTVDWGGISEPSDVLNYSDGFNCFQESCGATDHWSTLEKLNLQDSMVQHPVSMDNNRYALWMLSSPS